jgi:hypothetical protein
MILGLLWTHFIFLLKVKSVFFFTSEAKLSSHKHLHMLHQTTNTNTLHGDHMIEIMKASTFEFCDLLRSVKDYLRWIKYEMILDVR